MIGIARRAWHWFYGTPEQNLAFREYVARQIRERAERRRGIYR